MADGPVRTTNGAAVIASEMTMTRRTRRLPAAATGAAKRSARRPPANGAQEQDDGDGQCSSDGCHHAAHDEPRMSAAIHHRPSALSTMPPTRQAVPAGVVSASRIAGSDTARSSTTANGSAVSTRAESLACAVPAIRSSRSVARANRTSATRSSGTAGGPPRSAHGAQDGGDDADRRRGIAGRRCRGRRRAHAREPRRGRSPGTVGTRALSRGRPLRWPASASCRPATTGPRAGTTLRRRRRSARPGFVATDRTAGDGTVPSRRPPAWCWRHARSHPGGDEHDAEDHAPTQPSSTSSPPPSQAADDHAIVEQWGQRQVIAAR